jgi:NADPH-dependent 2,4-dienoyl-CoA reductase/sulfur reductase-like enzyme
MATLYVTMNHHTYLIVGAGIAGVKAAEAIRTVDRNGSILLLSEEDRLPYKRTKIDKHLHCGFQRDQFILHPPSWYEERNIDLLLNARVRDLLPDQKVVLTEDGGRHHYEKLLLSTGADHTLPGGLEDRRQLFHCIRAIHQAESVAGLLVEASHVTILGGGVQGVEMADQCLKAGKSTTLIHNGPHLMGKHLPPEFSLEVAGAFTQARADIYLDSTVVDLNRSGAGRLSVDIGRRSFQTDLLLVSVGARPATRLAQRAGLKTDHGIVINGRFETSLTSIYAAGDNTRMENGYATELWHGAEYQGILAGKSMAGSPQDFIPKAFRLKCEILEAYYFSMNYARSKHLEPRRFTSGAVQQTWFVEADTVRGVVMKNDKARAKTYEKAICEGWSLGRVLEQLGL